MSLLSATPVKRRTTTKSLRLLADEARAWDAAAEAAGVTLSNWLRNCVAAAGSVPAAATRRAPAARMPKHRPPPKVDPELMRQLAWIGNNVNQLARVANASGDLPGLVALAEIEAQLLAVERAVADAR